MTESQRHDEWGALQRYAEQVLTRRGLPRIKLELTCDGDGLPCGIRPVGGQLTIPTLRHQLDRLTEEKVHDMGISSFRRIHARRMRKEVSAILHRVEAAEPSMAMEVKTPSLPQERPTLSRRFTLSGVLPIVEAAGGASMPAAQERLLIQFLDEVHERLALDVEEITGVCRRVVPAKADSGAWRTVRVYRTPRYTVEIRCYTSHFDFLAEDRLKSWSLEQLVDDIDAIADGQKQLRSLQCLISRRDTGEGLEDAMLFAYVDSPGERSRERRVVARSIRQLRSEHGGRDGLRPQASISASAA
ncbi:hypothetical protein [Halomonas sp. C05BenzN]|uniref:hypothetical protein n=1 Tax=Halomonas sp. C05BenzN TaxID=3411041 RepID=UPI003B947396